MSSTNKTANLELNQWVSSDPFSMADFNADNRKIDDALGAIPQVKLFDVTFTENTMTTQFDLTDIDLSQYAQLRIFTYSSNASQKRLRLNGISAQKYFYTTGNGGNGTDICIGLSGVECILSLGKTTDYARSDGDFWCYSMSKVEFGSTLNTLELFVFNSTYQFVAGDRITIWGVKR